MRRGRWTSMVVCAAMVASALVTGASSPAAATTSRVVGPCTKVGPLDVGVSERPASCQRIEYRYGPLHITPGDNLILFGPVSIEKPHDGYIVRFVPDLIRVADEKPPGIHEIHLHHAVWISTGHGQPMVSTGEEKTVKSFPPGYGLRVRPQHAWVLNYMIHNQFSPPENVYVTWTIDFVPSGTEGADQIKAIEPIWLNVGGFNGANPTYNVKRGFGTGGECAFPRQVCADVDPYNKSPQGPHEGKASGTPVEVKMPGTIVFMDGHMHPGGLRMEADLRRGGRTVRAFQSDAVYFNQRPPVSWDMAMEATTKDFRLQVQRGDWWIVNSVYETTHGSWYEAMGIIHYFVDPLGTDGPNPFDPAQWNPVVDPNRAGETHGHLPEAGEHGGPDNLADIRTGPPVESGSVVISNFQYTPGGSGIEKLGVPAVRQGKSLRFVNADVQAAIFHTVTACKAPCNGPTGLSYPLADGPVDFDSQELGYGPPGFTPASNRATWDLPGKITQTMTPGTYTFFCRVHPFMRGQLQVLPAA